MRIIYDHQIFSIQEYGGISRYFAELSHQINKMDEHQVKILAPIHINNYLKKLPEEMVKGVHTKRLPRTGKVLRTCNNIISNVWVKSIQPDIIHATYFYCPGKKPRESGKAVITVYDMIHEKFPDSISMRDNTAQMKIEAIQQADHVICISDKTRLDLIDIVGINPDKTSTIHLGFRPFHCLSSNVKPPFDSPYMLYVGMRKGYKNFKTLIKAYANSQPLKQNIRLICFGGGAFDKDELAFMNELGLTENQIFQIGGNDELLAACYKNATAFVFPSRYEGFGIPPLEAMSLGCPVICSSVGSIPEIVGSAGEYFNPNDPDEISQAIENVVFNEERSNVLRNLGYQQIKKYSWERCAQETLHIYQSLL
jgi:glycosyltransferase involved in cell wall biosynthesis